LKNNLAPLLEIIDDATGYGTLIFFYGLSSAIGLLLLGTWRLMTNAWENHFILFAMLMGFVTLLGANAVGQSKS
nr:hypothetical protein [Euryarchaeota archaeon]